MKKNIFPIISAFFSFHFSFSQVTFQKIIIEDINYSYSAAASQITSEGGYVICGKFI
jgi:hypothetical protein